MFAATADRKIDPVKEYIADLLEEGKIQSCSNRAFFKTTMFPSFFSLDDFQFVVFAHHHVMLDAICELLTSKKTQFIRIDGSVSGEKRGTMVQKFQV